MKSEARLPFYLTMQYLRRGRKWTLFLTLLMLTIAFINLIFVPALFNGIVEGTNNQIINSMTGNIFITPKEGSEYINQKKETIASLKKIQGVVGTSAQTNIQGQLKYNKISGTWQVLAINPEEEATVTNISQKMFAGKYLDKNDTNQIIIGKQIAGGEDVDENAFSFKNAQIGDKVILNGNGINKEFIIKGIFQTKFISSDERAFITEKAFNDFFPSLENKTNTIILKTNNNVSEDEIISKIEKEKINVQSYSWKEVAGTMKSVSESFTSINIIMGFTAILIAAVTVFIVIYVDIVNKRKQIGILRAIGIKTYIIIFSYVILAAVYSVIGVLFGSLIFQFILVPYFQAYPFVLPICDATLILKWTDFIARAEAMMWVSVFSGLIPSIVVTKANMLDEILGR